MRTLFALLLLTLCAAAEPLSTVTVTDLRCENQTNPEAIRTATPRLSWKISGPGRGVHQTTFHLLVASTAEKLAASEGDLWDSGEVTTNRSHLVPFQGDPLKDGQRAHWKVQIKDHTKKPVAWSAPAQFQINLQAEAPKPKPLFVADAPRISSFACSDPSLDKLYAAAAKALPKATSLRDTHLSLRGASYHQNLFPRATDWFNWLNASVDDQQRYPATLPPDGTFGSTQSDAGILAAHTLWTASGDRTFLSDHWKTMNEYLHARKKHDPSFSGRAFGALPADTLPANDPFPPEAVHLASHGLTLRIMTELSRTAAKTPFETPLLQSAHTNLQESFREKHLKANHELKDDSLAGLLITLRYGLLTTPEEKTAVKAQLRKLLSTKKDLAPSHQGPLAAAALFPVLTWTAQHDEAIMMAKGLSADDLSPVALVNLSEWLIWMVAGIDSAGAGFQTARLTPYIPKKETLSFAKAHLDTPFGRIVSHWHYEDDGLAYDLSLPGNTNGIVTIPAAEGQSLTEGGKPLAEGNGIMRVTRHPEHAEILLLGGSYQFKRGK